jgi:hypothetical protein
LTAKYRSGKPGLELDTREVRKAMPVGSIITSTGDEVAPITGSYQPRGRDPVAPGQNAFTEFTTSNLVDALAIANGILGGEGGQYLYNAWTFVNVIRTSDGKGFSVMVDYVHFDDKSPVLTPPPGPV